MSIKKGDRLPARKSTRFYAKLKGELTGPQRIGISLDAADMAILARIQSRRYKRNGGRKEGPTAILRDALIVLDREESAA